MVILNFLFDRKETEMETYPEELKKVLSDHIDKNKGKLNYNAFKREYPDKYLDIQKIANQHKIKFVEACFWIIHDIFELPTCAMNGPDCIHSLRFGGFQKGYPKYCNKCVWKSEEFKQKTKEGVIKKYGVDNVQHLQSVREKMIKTNIEKYGSACPIHSEENKQKWIDSCNHLKKVYRAKREIKKQEVEKLITKSKLMEQNPSSNNNKEYRTGSTSEYNQRMNSMTQFLQSHNLELLDYCGDECPVYVKCLKCNHSFEAPSYLKLKSSLDNGEEVCQNCYLNH